MKKIIFSIFVLVLPLLSNAQVKDNMYFNVDWQVNSPVGTKYADKISGWGMNFESGCFVTNNITLGAFLAYHSNNKYIDAQTLQLSDQSALHGDQQHHIYQLPFGLSSRYVFNRGSMLQPYVGLKLGANYSKTTSQMNVFLYSQKEWGFYTSPEIGVNAYVGPNKAYGIHLAAYYSYGTNKTDILSYSMDGISNVGFRVGLAF